MKRTRPKQVKLDVFLKLQGKKRQNTSTCYFEGDLLTFGPADVIVQQCNCVTVKAHGLSASIRNAFPYADIYGNRRARSPNQAKQADTPGKCILCKPLKKNSYVHQPQVACLLSQFYPGRPGNYWKKVYTYDDGKDIDDSCLNRLKWFKEALIDLAAQLKSSKPGKINVAFPYKIGCGLAGGHWNLYEKAIKDWEQTHLKSYNIYIVKLCQKE